MLRPVLRPLAAQDDVVAEPDDCTLAWTSEEQPDRAKQGTAHYGRASVVLRPRTLPDPLPDGWHATAVRREAGMADSVVEAGAGGAFRVQLAAAPGGLVEVVFALLDPDGAEGEGGPIMVTLITPPPPSLVR